MRKRTLFLLFCGVEAALIGTWVWAVSVNAFGFMEDMVILIIGIAHVLSLLFFGLAFLCFAWRHSYPRHRLAYAILGWIFLLLYVGINGYFTALNVVEATRGYQKVFG